MRWSRVPEKTIFGVPFLIGAIWVEGITLYETEKLNAQENLLSA